MADTDSPDEQRAQHEDGNGRPRKSQAPQATKSPRARSGAKREGGPSRSESDGGAHHSSDHGAPHSSDHEGHRLTAAQAARRAARELAELTNKDLEGVVGIRKDGDRWTVDLEALEMPRIPSTTDVLAVYEVTLDAAGELVGYERVARYVRGDAGEDRS
jgi:hypothetical protein